MSTVTHNWLVHAVSQSVICAFQTTVAEFRQYTKSQTSTRILVENEICTPPKRHSFNLRSWFHFFCRPQWLDLYLVLNPSFVSLATTESLHHTMPSNVLCRSQERLCHITQKPNRTTLTQCVNRMSTAISEMNICYNASANVTNSKGKTNSVGQWYQAPGNTNKDNTYRGKEEKTTTQGGFEVYKQPDIM